MKSSQNTNNVENDNSTVESPNWQNDQFNKMDKLKNLRYIFIILISKKQIKIVIKN